MFYPVLDAVEVEGDIFFACAIQSASEEESDTPIGYVDVSRQTNL